MPIYEYQCSACGHQLEVLQKMTDEPMKICPVCQKTALNKLVSAAGLQFKGSGWYLTDYSNKGKPKQETMNETKEGAKKEEPAKANALPAANTQQPSKTTSKPVKESTSTSAVTSSDKASKKSGE